MINTGGGIGHGPVEIGRESAGERGGCFVFRETADEAGDGVADRIGEIASGGGEGGEKHGRAIVGVLRGVERWASVVVGGISGGE